VQRHLARVAARLAGAGVIDAPLAERLARAAGFRNLVAHAYARVDMRQHARFETTA
jgi:uncharacterized protein YutE (UPF0331/DUF86 family)